MEMRKYRIILAFCLFISFVWFLPLEAFQTVGGTFTHCYEEGKGSGDGGFYKCDESGCTWIESDDPKLSTIQECDQSQVIG